MEIDRGETQMSYGDLEINEPTLPGAVPFRYATTRA